MRVLIVGCGYVGLPLGQELVRQGHHAFGLRRSASAGAELQAAGICPLVADITKPETLVHLPRDFDWVVNCAATSGGDAEAYRQLYLVGNRNLIEWFCPRSRGRQSAPSVGEKNQRRLTSAATLKKFVYTSSTSVYGQNDGSVVTETDPVGPPTETGKVLVATENLILAAATEINLPSLILRVAGIYGPDRGSWLKQLWRGEARIEGDGTRFLNMIHREDVVGAIIAALKSAPVPSVFNAVDNEPVSQRDFLEWLSKQLGKPLPPTVPENAEAIRKRGLTNKRVSNRRLKQQLGYQFKYPTFRQGYTAELRQLV